MFDLTFESGIARLTLNRPDARNAIAVQDWLALANRLEEIEKADARLLIVVGAGSAFCSGADLGDFPHMRADADARSGFRRAMRNALDRFAALPMPSVALIDGACYGAGVALAMACDIRLAGPNARFAITPAKFGISYPQEDVHRLASLLGPGQAARLLLSAETIDGNEAERIGLVERCFPERFEEQATAFVAAVGGNEYSSLQTLKRGIALAAQAKAQDSEQDRIFDELLGSETLARRLVERRRS